MKLLKSFVYAWHGIRACFTSEINFKIHSVNAVAIILLGFALDINAVEWLLILFFIALVLAMEMMNTAIEKLSDVVHAGIHPAIKMIKDIAAGAVLVTAAGSFISGIIIFLPKITALIKSFQLWIHG